MYIESRKPVFNSKSTPINPLYTDGIFHLALYMYNKPRRVH